MSATIRRVIRLAAALGIATAVTLGLTAAPAQAAPLGALTARLIVQGSGSDCKVTIGGNLQTGGTAQAQALIDSGATARTELWGDDAYYDNRLKKFPARLHAVSERNGGDLFISTVAEISCLDLDEDNKPPFDYGDEIYAKIIFEAPGARATKTSNTVRGTFGFE